MSDDEVNAMLEKANRLASKGFGLTDEAMSYGWCARKKALISEAFELFKAASETINFIKEA